MHIKHISLLLTLITIPIHTKISIPKLSERISSAFNKTSIFHKTKEEITHHEFNHIDKLEISNPYGNISIEPWNQSCILIELRKKGSLEFISNVKLNTNHQENTLIVSPLIKNEKIKGNIHIHILAPKNLPIKINTQKGCVSSKNHNGTLNITTESGNIDIIDGTNTVLAKTIQGKITVQRKKIMKGHALNLQADYGTILLRVPQEIEADLQAHTSFGKISSCLFISLHSQTVQINDETFKSMKHNIHGWIGQPQSTKNPATILLQTNYGMINIEPYNLQSKPYLTSNHN